ncbi:Enolase C-terminal domain-like [Phytophthora cactorum]|nr:Enolase C-terminal domain-like [Phytophthora cactorum]
MLRCTSAPLRRAASTAAAVHSRARDHRQPRKPHGRGGPDAVGQHRDLPRLGALGRLHGHPRGCGAARWRQALRRQGRAAGRAERQERAAPKLIGADPTKQRDIDDLMREIDGTENKGKLGANAILGVSLAVAKAGAAAKGVPLYQHFADLIGNKNLVLPVPSFNVINGGSHAGNKLAFQEFMLLPTGAESFSEAMVMGCEVYHQLKSVIKKKYGQDATNVGDEAADDRHYHAGYDGKIGIGMDVASSEFLTKDGKLGLHGPFDRRGAGPVVQGPGQGIPDLSIEDPFDQDDWTHYSSFTAGIGEKVQIVGDDLLCTNPKRIATALDKKACNALLLKVNQIGSVTESVDAVALAQKNGWGVMTSHRSGETEDSYIADLAVGLATGQIKTGAPCRSERLAKYNQLLRIEEALGSDAKYAGKHFRNPSKISCIVKPATCTCIQIALMEEV